MPQVGAYEAKTRLSQLLEQVARGRRLSSPNMAFR